MMCQLQWHSYGWAWTGLCPPNHWLCPFCAQPEPQTDHSYTMAKRSRSVTLLDYFGSSGSSNVSGRKSAKVSDDTVSDDTKSHPDNAKVQGLPL